MKSSPLYKKSSPVLKMSGSPLHQPEIEPEIYTRMDDAIDFQKTYPKHALPTKAKTLNPRIGTKKIATQQTKKKMAKSLGKKIASRFIPFVGQAALAYDVYSIGKRVKKGEGLWSATRGHYLGQE